MTEYNYFILNMTIKFLTDLFIGNIDKISNELIEKYITETFGIKII